VREPGFESGVGRGREGLETEVASGVQGQNPVGVGAISQNSGRLKSPVESRRWES